MSGSGGPSKSTKQAFVFTGASSSATKRGTDADLSNESSNKKIRIDICTNPAWSAVNKIKSKRCVELNSSGVLQHTTMKEVHAKSLAVTVDSNIFQENSGMITQSTNDGSDIVIIRNVNSQDLNETISDSPMESVDESSDNYVVFSSDVIVEDDDCIVATPSSMVSTTTVASHNTDTLSSVLDSAVTIVSRSSDGVSPQKNAHVNTTSAVDAPEVLNIKSATVAHTSAVDEIEVVLLPALQDTKKTTTLELLTNNTAKTTTLTRITPVTSGSLMCQSQISSSGISTVGGTSAGLSTTTTVLNRVGMQAALKNQPLMVTSKKLMSEVMQTTAKVSIGNTTISVPLLKPLNSKQLIQSGSFVGELQKQSQSGNFQTQSGQTQAQTQLNLSKILNVKRGQKPNQPTIVSLSQLQIKPAKIVQAKVLGKKMQMPLQLQQVPTTTLSNSAKSTSSIVTICGSKQTKQNVIHNFCPKISQLTVVQEPPSSTAIAEEEINKLFDSSVTTTDHLDAAANTSTAGQSSTNNKHMEINQTVERIATLPKDSIVVTTQAKVADGSEENSSCITTIKKVFTSSSVGNMPPLLSTLSKHPSDTLQVFKPQQHTINMSSAISIIKQTTPQLVTASALLNANSSPVVTTDSNFRTELLTGKTALSLNNSGTKLNTSLIPLSRNISLRLTKNNIGIGSGQQPKTTALTVANSSNIAVHNLSGSPTTEYLSKKINLSMPNTLNITEVHLSKSQANTVGISRSSDTSLKSGIISVVSQTHDAANITEHQETLQRKTLKIAGPPSALSIAGKQMKRSKSVDDSNERASPVQHAQVSVGSIRKQNIDVAVLAKRPLPTELEHRQTFTTESNDLVTKSSNTTLHVTSSNADIDNIQYHSDIKKTPAPAVAVQANAAKHESHVIAKSEESHNVLLKQLLQTTTASHSINQVVVSSTSSTLQAVPTSDPASSSSSICNQLLSARIINVRAPSLGLVSSLEAQLARPVMPPVTATSATPTHVEAETPDRQVKSHALADHHQIKNTESNITVTPKDVKLKSLPAQLISKETSFVSNPHLTVTSTEAGYRYSTAKPISTSSQEMTPSEGIASTVNIASTTPNTPNSNRNLTLDYSRLVTLEMNDDAKERKHIYTNAASNVIVSESPSVVGNNNTNSNTLSTIVSGQVLHIKAVDVESVQSNIVPSFEENDLKTNEKPGRMPKLYSSSHASSKMDDKNCSNAIPSPLITTSKPKKLVEHTPSTPSILSGTVEITSVNKIMDTPSEAKSVQLSSNVAHNSVEKDMLTDVAGRMKTASNTDKFITVTKDADFRKKRKREYQKQRRQLHNSNKESALNTTTFSAAPNPPNAKRRPRKFSKVEEDHDNFIENLMSRIRQMQPLQVQEPLLNRNFGVCGMQGRNNLNRLNSSNKDNEFQGRNQLVGEYGRARHWNMPSIYNTNDLTKTEDRSKNTLCTMQNDFYDQEFLPIIYKNEYDKHLRFIGLIRERNVEALETVNRISSSNSKNQFSSNCGENNCASTQIPYPGLVLMNNEGNHYLGRMSPVIPTVMPVQQRFKLPLNCLPNTFEEDSIKLEIKQEYDEKPSELLEHKIGKKEEMHLDSQTVILSLPPASADNILGILKDLANLLHIAPPTTYKILNAPDPNAVRHYRLRMPNRCNSKSQQYSNLQNILNGRRKMCRHCGQVISGADVVRVPMSKLPDIKPLINLIQLSTMDVHFCNKSCYEQFELQNKILPDLMAKATKLPTQTPEGTDIDTKSDLTPLGKGDRKLISDMDNRNTTKCRFKYFRSDCFKTVPQFKRLSEKELADVLFKMNITVSATNSVINLRDGNLLRSVEDIRQCILCNQRGDGLSDGTSRLLNFEVDKWVHLNCALWSNGVYETISGGLMNLQTALQVGLNQVCSSCQQLGATVKCFKNRCGTVFHLPCAIKKQCVFYKNKTMHCQQHAPRTEKDNELTSLTVHRRVFVERDENRQVATIMHHSELTNLLRVGSLTFLNVGQLLPHQLEAFHTANHIFPIGFKIIRFYWSMKRPNKRCRYVCSIAEVAGRPEFRIQVQDNADSDLELRDTTPKAVWQKILEPIAALRKDCESVQLFPQFITGEDLFGLTEPAIVRIIESLPGIETLTDYRFKYGRNPLLELPLAINPSGAARTEPKQRQLLGWRKPHTQRSATIFNQRTANSSSSVVAGEVACPYSKQFVHSKSSQYKKMKQEWRNNVYLARSKIQGLGLYAARDIEKHTMIIEYIGEVIRTEVSEIREKQYESKNRGIYMFRLDEDRVVDATLSGGLARYINHSCNPNCVTEIVEVDREVRIIIFAKRRINRGEELSYDYKFDIEDDANKIPCMCGAPNCRKWMN